jgi:hypothetical protein
MERGTAILNTYNRQNQVLEVSIDTSIESAPSLFLATCLAPGPALENVPLGVLAAQGFKLHSWYTSQRIQKPRLRSPLGSASCAEVLSGRLDDRKRRFWAKLGVVPADWDYLWYGENHADTTRQWAELSFWFPALSRPIGTRPMAGMSNEDFGLFRQPGVFSPLGLDTHSYMAQKPLPAVWPAFQRIGTFLRTGE